MYAYSQTPSEMRIKQETRVRSCRKIVYSICIWYKSSKFASTWQTFALDMWYAAPKKRSTKGTTQLPSSRNRSDKSFVTLLVKALIKQMGTFLYISQVTTFVKINHSYFISFVIILNFLNVERYFLCLSRTVTIDLYWIIRYGGKDDCDIQDRSTDLARHCNNLVGKFVLLYRIDAHSSRHQLSLYLFLHLNGYSLELLKTWIGFRAVFIRITISLLQWVSIISCI